MSTEATGNHKQTKAPAPGRATADARDKRVLRAVADYLRRNAGRIDQHKYDIPRVRGRTRIGS